MGPKSLYFVTSFAFNAPDGEIPWDNLRKILHRGQRMAAVHSGEEILPKSSPPPRVGCMNVIQTTDRQTDLRDRNDLNVT